MSLKRFLISKPGWIPPLLFAAISIAIYGSAMGHEFLNNWDDQIYVTNNPFIRGLTWDHVHYVFTHFWYGNYAPLNLISYMIDFEIFGMKPAGFIFTNIFIHTLNAVLFYYILTRLFPGKVVAFFAALLFLIHPVQVESVVWISERKNVLSMTFFLFSFLFYIFYKDKESAAGMKYQLLSLALFFLALLTKSVTIILPVVLIVYDLCYLERRDFGKLLVDKAFYFLLMAGFAYLTIVSQSPEYHGGRAAYYGGGPLDTFLTMLTVLNTYLRMVVWPAGLSALYDPPIKHGVDLAVAWAAFLCVLLAVLGFFLYRRKPWLFFWFALFFIALLPVSQIIPIVTLMNDRYLYFPMLGATAFLTSVIFRDMEWSGFSALNKSHLILLPVVLALAACAGVAVNRVDVWKNSYTLWGDVLRKVPNSVLANDGFGEALMARGKIDEAIGYFERTLAQEKVLRQLGESTSETNGINRGYRFSSTHNNLGVAYGTKGQTDKAIEQFKLAISLDPNYAQAYDNLGLAYLNKGMAVEAYQNFQKACKLFPQDPRFNYHLRQARKMLENR